MTLNSDASQKPCVCHLLDLASLTVPLSHYFSRNSHDHTPHSPLHLFQGGVILFPQASKLHFLLSTMEEKRRVNLQIKHDTKVKCQLDHFPARGGSQ